ncbi:MAG: hypothetical protein PHI73_04285 [Patescibacteria group bacterium]|nr:hypothetical protein [Patescibacteria group bacterium]
MFYPSLESALKGLVTRIRRRYGILLRWEVETDCLERWRVTFYAPKKHPFTFWRGCCTFSDDPNDSLYVIPRYHPELLGWHGAFMVNGATDRVLLRDEPGDPITYLSSPPECRTTDRAIDGSDTWNCINHPMRGRGQSFLIIVHPDACCTNRGFSLLVRFLTAALNLRRTYIEINGGFNPPYTLPHNVVRQAVTAPKVRGSEGHCVWTYRTLQRERRLKGSLVPKWFFDEGWLDLYKDEIAQLTREA